MSPLCCRNMLWPLSLTLPRRCIHLLINKFPSECPWNGQKISETKWNAISDFIPFSIASYLTPSSVSNVKEAITLKWCVHILIYMQKLGEVDRIKMEKIKVVVSSNEIKQKKKIVCVLVHLFLINSCFFSLQNIDFLGMYAIFFFFVFDVVNMIRAKR